MRAKLKVQQRLQEVAKVKNMKHLPRKPVGREQSPSRREATRAAPGKAVEVQLP